MIRVALAPLAALMLGAGAPAPSVDPAAVDAALDPVRAPGTVLIARGDTIVYERAFGLVDPAGAAEHQLGKVWRWASVTKQITATIAMQEVAAGRLDLDAPIIRYLPDSQAPNAGTISSRMLMQHISGLPRTEEGPVGLDDWSTFYMVDRSSPETGRAWCEGPTSRKPGDEFFYGDCDFIMMAAVIEATDPELPFWRQGRAWRLILIMGLGTSAYTLMLAWLPPFYIDLGEPRATAGYLLSGMTAAEVTAGLLVSLTIGRFADRRGPILTALALALAGLAGLVVAPLIMAVPIVIVLGLGIGAIFPLSLILAMDQIDDPARSGDLLAFVQGGGYIIASLSPLGAGLLRDHMADLTQAWVLMGVGGILLGAMTLEFRPGLPKLR